MGKARVVASALLTVAIACAPSEPAASPVSPSPAAPTPTRTAAEVSTPAATAATAAPTLTPTAAPTQAPRTATAAPAPAPTPIPVTPTPAPTPQPPTALQIQLQLSFTRTDDFVSPGLVVGKLTQTGTAASTFTVTPQRVPAGYLVADMTVPTTGSGSYTITNRGCPPSGTWTTANGLRWTIEDRGASIQVSSLLQVAPQSQSPTEGGCVPTFWGVLPDIVRSLDTSQLRFAATGGTVSISGSAVALYSQTTYRGTVTVARVAGQ